MRYLETLVLKKYEMESKRKETVTTVLNEHDISGASLCGRDPSSLKIPELKWWLLCRNASTKGNKADLMLRYVDYGEVVHQY